MIEIFLALIAVAVFAFILGIAIPAMTQSQADWETPNPHFTRRVFGMRRHDK